ncbi:hypothetical protein LX36DRAFT_705873 [Colletotrichum falcatum]|nr:hypothetical protein LX36DRAFT_705873 [Colletotrichum falcatum]
MRNSIINLGYKEFQHATPPASRRGISFAAAMAPHNDVAGFHEALRSSKRILALCGAGLSASSGLPTFRGAGGL